MIEEEKRIIEDQRGYKGMGAIERKKDKGRGINIED